MKRKLTSLLIAGALVATPAAHAQDPASGTTDLQSLRAAVKADKRALVASTLALSPDEAKRFWPLYDEYQRSLDAANRRRTIVAEDLLELTKPLSDLYAKQLAAEILAADEAELRARRKLQDALVRAIHPSKAVRYLQLEGKIRAYHAYDAAVAFPLVR